jgi:UDP-glucose 4-epimerase
MITGSRGFVGGSVGSYAAAAGHEVLGIGRSSQPATDWSGSYLQADIASVDLSASINEFAPDVILHAAGTASVGASLLAPFDDLRAAALTWANLLEGVRRSNHRPLLLFPSSAAVYGNPAELPVHEEMPMRPISPYGFHKAVCEMLAREYASCFGLEVIVCRLFSIFGARQRRLLVWELYRQLTGDEQVAWLEGTGLESRDYLHIDDAAAALFELIEGSRKARQPPGGCLIVNVAGGEEINVTELARQIRDRVAPGKEIRCRGAERAGDPRRWRADVSRLRELAPRWQPVSFSTRLAQCLAAWQKESEL